MTNNESREAFEKWCATKKISTERTPDDYYSYDVENALIGWQARQPEIDALKARIAELEAQTQQLEEACNEFRDSVLNWRYQLEEGTIDGDQTNAVLGLFDDTIGSAKQHVSVKEAMQRWIDFHSDRADKAEARIAELEAQPRQLTVEQAEDIAREVLAAEYFGEHTERDLEIARLVVHALHPQITEHQAEGK